MLNRPHIRRQQPSILRGTVALVCVLLILLVGAAHLLHTHGSNQAADPGCSLCAAAHMPALAAPMLAAPIRTQTLVDVRAVEHLSVPRSFPALRLYIRPPPVANA